MLRYGDHEDQVVDVRGGGPTVLVLHGGFWRQPYAKDLMDDLCAALARDGWRAANVEYRRLGPGGYREMLDDVAAAAALLPGAVSLGHSAGGHLALWLASRGLVRGAVGLGAVCDLRAAAHARLGNDAVRELLGGDDDEAFDAADPAARLPFAAAQVLVHGSADDTVPVEHARAYAARSGAELVELDGVDHFEPIDPCSRAYPAVRDALSRASGS